MNNIYLSVVIPAYNEEKNLELGVLDQVNNYLKKQRFSWEVVIVDDGSKDNTASLIEKLIKSRYKHFNLLKEPHRGKGGTVIAGMLAAKGNIILFTDMDQATPITEISKILPKFEKGYDIVIGSRAGRKGAPLTRKVMAYGFAILRTVILRLPFRDTQCGFKAFNKKSAQDIFRKMKIYSEKSDTNTAGVTAGFDLELLYIARKLHLKVAEVEVNWQHKGSERVSPLKDSWEGFRDLLKVRYNAFLGKYS